MKKKNSRVLAVLFGCIMICLLGGCSRRTMNRQIAESIGTLGKYENDEPVETPKMKAQREIEEAKKVAEEKVSGHLAVAERLAASYDYKKALAELAQIDEAYQEDSRVLNAKIEYQRLQNMMISYNEEIPHFSVKSLIVDPALAFDGDDMSYYYNNWMLTADEFKKILQSLYEKNYILIDIRETIVEIENEDGTISFAVNMPEVPKGKKPIILSFTEANYYGHTDGNGFSDKMVLDENGNVQNSYTNADGETVIGAYDVVPIVDAFIEEHPDFSLRSAKGIVSLTGYEGAFGYGLETGSSTIKEIAERLKADGWQIACQGYENSSLENDLTYDEMVADIEAWDEKIGSLVGETDILIYPYGESVSAGTLKMEYLLEHGFQYLLGLWNTAEFIEVKPDYVYQTRRNLDGYDLYFWKEYFTDFFNTDEILDPVRPAFE